jgi:hypothetical protein
LRILKGIPGINLDYDKNTVTFEAASYKDAYDGITALVRMATLGYQSLLFQAIGKNKEGRNIFDEYSDSLLQRWQKTEKTAEKKYFGVR